MKKMFSSYKTAIPGILAIALVGMYVFGKIDSTQLAVAGTFLTGAGLIAAKDGDKKEPR